MTNFLKHYGTTEGPLGLPMQDRQAFQLESILKALPPEDRALKHAIVAKAPTELLDGERADVSWISTEEIDRDRDCGLTHGVAANVTEMFFHSIGSAAFASKHKMHKPGGLLRRSSAWSGNAGN